MKQTKHYEGGKDMDDNTDSIFSVDEKREETRLTLDADIYIETVSPEPGENTLSEIVKCECIDLSANGLQVSLKSKLVPGAIHALIVEINHPKHVFKLTAEVKWVKPSSNDAYVTGLFLYDSDGTEIIDWKFMMAEYLS